MPRKARSESLTTPAVLQHAHRQPQPVGLHFSGQGLKVSHVHSKHCLAPPEVGGLPPVGALCFYQAHFGRAMLPKWPFLGASCLLCILQCFRVWEGMLPPGARRMSHASARRIVSCRDLCVSSLCSQIPLAPAPTFGAKHCLVGFVNRLCRTEWSFFPWRILGC